VAGSQIELSLVLRCRCLECVRKPGLLGVTIMVGTARNRNAGSNIGHGEVGNKR
jgi:hypothetical protein